MPLKIIQTDQFIADIDDDCRYYINRVKDVYRQAIIDLMLGNAITEDLSLLGSNKFDATDCDSEMLIQKEENLKTLIDESKKMLITEPEDCLGGWGLIDADNLTGDPSHEDMDIILLLSQKAYYIAK